MNNDYLVIDTHTLLWYITGDFRLGRNAAEAMNAAEARLVIPAIALAEALFILERKRDPYPLNEAELLREVEKDPRMEVIPLDEETVAKTLVCTQINEMHDRQIVAGALLIQNRGFAVAILTKDTNITDSSLVPCVW